METLQRAFQNIYDTMDAIDTFKLKALDSMKTTVTSLEGEVAKSKGYIARAEGASQAQASVGGADSPLASLEGYGMTMSEGDKIRLSATSAIERSRTRRRPIGPKSAALRRQHVYKQLGRMVGAGGIVWLGSVVFGAALIPARS